MKLKFIDSIRGIAILMVILIHTSQEITNLDRLTYVFSIYGRMGVQLFFMASAYTLCLSETRRDNEHSHLLKYGIRRIFRIAPAYYVGIIIYFLILLTISKINYGNFIVPEKYTFFNIFSNIFFFHGFYPPGNNVIVYGGWSIGTEMAFYAIFPILIKIAMNKISSIKNVIQFVFGGIIFSQILLATLYFFGYKVSNNNFIYFNIVNQLPVFLVGIGYFFFKKIVFIQLKWFYDLISFIFLTILSIVLWIVNIDYLYSIIPIISAFSFIFLFELFQKFDFLNHKYLIRIGQLSYSMYLFHFIFAYFLNVLLLREFKVKSSSITLLIFYMITVFFTFILALFSEKYIEKPGVQYGKKIIKKLDFL